METNLRGEVVIIQKERPACLFPAFPWSESICGKTKHNVARIGEEGVRAFFTIDNYFFPTETTVVISIHDILDSTVFRWFVSPSILELINHGKAAIVSAEARDDAQSKPALG
jgi:hypothetical protein